MGEILGLGVTHYPGLAGPDENFSGLLKVVQKDPKLPEQYRSPEGWPEPMRQEWGDDQGLKAAQRHREAMVTQFRKARRLLDDFKPDFVLIWGDDQFENFQEDIIPPFCILAYDSVEARPWAEAGLVGSKAWGKFKNAWGEPEDKTFFIKGYRPGAKFLTSRLLEEGFDIAYAYQPLHRDVGHAFLNTILYLDYDRQGWDYPTVPFAVNCFGRGLVAQRGAHAGFAEALSEAALDPPSAMPWRCFDLGAAIARVLVPSPWRVALIASSSWSHGTLSARTHFLHPDIEADREMHEALRSGDYDKWRNTPLTALEESGQHEMLNWFCLIGAMAELGRRPKETALIETWLFNGNRCFAFF